MTEQTRPNILYIHTDQHNPFVTGCYGDPLVETPNLDRLADGGAVFDAVYCSSPICVPSRMSMLTGRHPYENQVWTNNHILHSGIPTVAHAMGAAGYHPTLVGRMHAVGPDQLHGYAKRLVGDHSPNFLGNPGPDRGILDGTAGPERTSLVRSGAGQSAYQVHDEYVAAATVDCLNRMGVEKRTYGAVEPFSITVGFMLPHPPYVARREDFERYSERISMPDTPESIEDVQHAYVRKWRAYTGIEQVSAEEIRRARAAYWGLVHRVDILVGEILRALTDNGLAEKTLIVYTSDHGDMQGEHGLWWKHTFYEESVRVPLILHWPGVIEPGQRCNRVVSALDVTATLVEAASAQPLPSSSGRSLLGLVSKRYAQPAWEDVAFSEYCADQYAPDGETYQRMIRAGDWKLIYYQGHANQLFNLADDPKERHDRASDPSCAGVHRELEERILEGWNPALIAQRLAELRAENALLTQWARQTSPADMYHWELRPEMNRLDGQAPGVRTID